MVKQHLAVRMHAIISLCMCLWLSCKICTLFLLHCNSGSRPSVIPKGVCDVSAHGEARFVGLCLGSIFGLSSISGLFSENCSIRLYCGLCEGFYSGYCSSSLFGVLEKDTQTGLLPLRFYSFLCTLYFLLILFLFSFIYFLKCFVFMFTLRCSFCMYLCKAQ